jgi:hypothetical protein
VAIIHQGELRGVGAVVEPHLQRSWPGGTGVARYGGAGIVAGPGRGMPHHRETRCGPSSPRPTRIQPSKPCAGKVALISVTPVRTSLEDYFMQKLQPAGATVGGRV